MRPDIEDFEELETAAGDTPRSRAMSWLVLAVAVGGFGALAYYAYHSGSETMQNGDVMVVEADGTPIKQTPADPEGEQFANQDKTIYDVISPNATGEGNVEKLLPEPEKPVSAPQEVAASTPAPTTYVNKNIANAGEGTTAEKPAPLVVPVPSAVVNTPVAKAEEVKTPVAATTTKVSPHVAVTNVSPDEEAGEPTFVNESPVADVKATTKVPTKAVATSSVKKEVVKEVVKKEVTKPVEKKAVSGGAYQIQLGAFKSEDEALAHWKKLSGKYASVLSGSPSVVKADLPNGTFYRLRTGGFASGDAAKAACGKLGGQACFPVAK